MSTTSPDRAMTIDAFLAHVEACGCVRESEVEELVALLDLGEAELDELRSRLEAAGVEVSDDCGRSAAPLVYANGDLAGYTVDTMTQFLAGAGRYPLLTAAEEIALAKRIERGDMAAKDRLISSNLRLVVSIAKRYPATPQMPLIDLVQEGTLGLIRAAEKFDWRRGYKFSTYATFWIRQAISRGLSVHSRDIRLPHHVDQRQRNIAAAHARLSRALGVEPTPEQLATETGLTPSQVRDVLAAPRVVTSIDRPIGEAGDTLLAEIVPADQPEAGEELHIELGHAAVRRAVAGMPEPERSVLKLRYGLDGDPEPQNYTAIGRRLGLKIREIREIEEHALKELALRRELAALREAA